MGWAALILLAAVAAALLWLLRLPRMLWAATGMVLMLGCAGYALQGRPGMPGATPKPQVDAIEVAPEFVTLREEMWGRFTQEAALATAADGLLRAGNTQEAAQVALAAVRRYPKSAEVWTNLGSVLATHDGGNMSPPALFAFRRAMALAPRHPAPRFFFGLALIQGGKIGEARAAWVEALRLTPAKATYRAAIGERIALLDMLAAQMAQQQPAPQQQ
ncbi:tetratricopeptide repeat protein [Sphingomonas sp.]|uniref:tetratricopeptide repeat protein n=1 Tax=Sphingomonas sp. TaxID=28214 RepID=UPI001DDA7B87|nr:tetratricopeptide repeat protein [Sphingomonas sp.]MBX9797800.1 tetratricopeptide repeat protein [Sphingomonas sp.]